MIDLFKLRRVREQLQLSLVSIPVVADDNVMLFCDGCSLQCSDDCSGTCSGTCDDTCENRCEGCGNAG